MRSLTPLLFITLCLLLSVTSCSSEDRESIRLVGAVGLGPGEVAVSVDMNGKVSLTGGVSAKIVEFGVKLGVVHLTAGIEATQQLTRDRKYHLFILRQDESGQIWRDEYEIGKKFRVTFPSGEHVQEISGDNDNIIVVVNMQRVAAPSRPTEPPSAQPPSPPIAAPPQRAEPPVPSATPQSPMARTTDGVHLRSGPGTAYPQIGSAQAGASFRITGRNSESSWWQVCCISSGSAWISGNYLQTSGLVSSVPVVAVGPPPTQPPAPTLASCVYLPGPSFARLWDRNKIGCPTNQETGINTAYESFQKGWMLWRQDDNGHYALLGNGAYQVYFYPPAEPPNFACSEAQVKGMPRRGFSKVWCEVASIRSQIGDATGDEVGDYRPLQKFENGFMIYVKERGTVVSVYQNGTWFEQR